MSTPPSRTDESQITTDRETIRGWVGEHDAVPVRYSGVEGESGTLRIVPERDVGETGEEVPWDEFFAEIDRNDQVVVYHGADHPQPFEVTARDRAIGRTTVADESVEEALAEGETVTSEVRETTVIERTVVEEATVESEVTDRELVSEEVVDAELLTRDVVEFELVDEGGGTEGGMIDVARFEPGYSATLSERPRVEVVVDEGWTVTKEVVERLTIESRVVDTEATETDTVEADTVESTVDLAGVQRTIVESDLVDTDAGADVVEGGHVESEFREGDVVETWLVERKTVDEEVGLRRRLAGEISEDETVSVDAIGRQVIESGFVEEDLEGEVAEAGAETPSMAETGEGTVSAGAVDDGAAMPSEDDEGKPVVDASGSEVGMVVDVEDDTVYVEPHPSTTDRIRTALGWGEADEDDYAVGPDRIARITDDAVELVSVEPAAGDEAR